MSADKTIPKKKSASLVRNQEFDPARHIAPVVAHELNNILTIVQGYADRLLLRNAQNPALMHELKLVSEAARRAAIVIRNARPINANEAFKTGAHPPHVNA